MSLSLLIREFFLGDLTKEIRHMAMNVQHIIDEVAKQTTKIDSINTMMDNMRQQILDRIAEGQLEARGIH